MAGTYEITGNDGFNGGTASLAMRIDEGNLGDTITAVPACAPAVGVGSISNKKGDNTITFIAAGQVCETIAPMIAPTIPKRDVFIGSYVINGGTGKFSSATGAGTIGASASFLTDSSLSAPASQASFSGSVQR
jgi:hypothetical protein